MEHELMKRRVVVTGLGLVTPLGNTLEATWAGLMAGRSGACAAGKSVIPSR
jgi:3-oxoacyl-[acyl-carrier-protein] synthase II